MFVLKLRITTINSLVEEVVRETRPFGGASRLFWYNASMQCVILAAGRGTRMGDLTKTLPKPLLEVNGKTLLEHKFDVLPKKIEEIILVIGHLGDTIKKRFGNSYGGKKITYAEQGPVHGTAGALWSARPFLRDKFIVMMGDDLYGKKDVGLACNSGTWMMFAIELPRVRGGKITAENGIVKDIIESDEHGTGGLVSTNLFSLDVRLFEYEMVPKRADSEEYGLPQTALAASRVSGIPLELVQTDAWIQITSPEDLHYAEKMALKIGA